MLNDYFISKKEGEKLFACEKKAMRHRCQEIKNSKIIFLDKITDSEGIKFIIPSNRYFKSFTLHFSGVPVDKLSCLVSDVYHKNDIVFNLSTYLILETIHQHGNYHTNNSIPINCFTKSTICSKNTCIRSLYRFNQRVIIKLLNFVNNADCKIVAEECFVNKCNYSRLSTEQYLENLVCSRGIMLFCSESKMHLKKIISKLVVKTEIGACVDTITGINVDRNSEKIITKNTFTIYTYNVSHIFETNVMIARTQDIKIDGKLCKNAKIYLMCYVCL